MSELDTSAILDFAPQPLPEGRIQFIIRGKPRFVPPKGKRFAHLSHTLSPVRGVNTPPLTEMQKGTNAYWEFVIRDLDDGIGRLRSAKAYLDLIQKFGVTRDELSSVPAAPRVRSEEGIEYDDLTVYGVFLDGKLVEADVRHRPYTGRDGVDRVAYDLSNVTPVS